MIYEIKKNLCSLLKKTNLLRLLLKGVDVLLDQVLGVLIPDKSQTVRGGRVEIQRPASQDSLEHGVGLKLEELELVLATVLGQAVHQLLDGGRHTGEVDVASVGREGVVGEVQDTDQVLDGAAGRADV